MAIIKYAEVATGKPKWESIYGKELKNRLKRSNNLSDLTNTQEALINLELTGNNNTTHAHDSRYLTLINETIGELQRLMEERTNQYETEKQELINKINELEISVANFPTLIINLLNMLDNKIVVSYEEPVKAEKLIWYDLTNSTINVSLNNAWVSMGGIYN